MRPKNRSIKWQGSERILRESATTALVWDAEAPTRPAGLTACFVEAGVGVWEWLAQKEWRSLIRRICKPIARGASARSASARSASARSASARSWTRRGIERRGEEATSWSLKWFGNGVSHSNICEKSWLLKQWRWQSFERIQFLKIWELHMQQNIQRL